MTSEHARTFRALRPSRGITAVGLVASLLTLLASPAGAFITERVSVDSAGIPGNGQSGSDIGSISISADGRFVAFASRATNLVPGDTNSRADVFVHNRQTGI